MRKRPYIYMVACECCGKKVPEVATKDTIGVDGNYRRKVCRSCYEEVMKFGYDSIDSYAFEESDEADG